MGIAENIKTELEAVGVDPSLYDSIIVAIDAADGEVVDKTSKDPLAVIDDLPATISRVAGVPGMYLVTITLPDDSTLTTVRTQNDDGSWAVAPAGFAGPQGPAGEDGADGADGAAGAAGLGLTPLTARTQRMYSTDYTGVTSVQGDFLFVALNSGANAVPTVTMSANHPGVIRLNSSASANSGGGSLFSVGQIVLAGYEIYEGVFYMPAAFTNRTFKCGFVNSTTQTEETDGVYFRLSGSGDVIGRCMAASTPTDSGTIATLSVSTWYFFRIVINSAATSAAFSIYNDAGTQQGSTANVAGLPTAAVSCGFYAFNSAGSTSGELVHYDYQGLSLGRVITRGPAS